MSRQSQLALPAGRPGVSYRGFVFACILFPLLVAGAFVASRAVWPCPEGPPGNLSAADIGAERLAKLKDSAEERVKGVQELTGELHSLGTRLLIGAALAVYLVRTTRGEFKVPIIDVAVPLHWVQLALPAVIVFWFLDWGFVLHRVIDSRMEAWFVLAAADSDAGIPTAAKEPLSVFSSTHALRDNFFVDQWILAFRPSFSSIQESGVGVVNRAILSAFGTTLALSLGAAFACLANVRPRFPNSRWTAAFFWIYLIACAGFVLASPLAFVYGGFHANWLLYLVLGATAPISLLLILLGR